MAKKRKKKQSTKQIPRSAQPTAKRGEATPKPKQALPSLGIKRWIAPIALALVVIAGLIAAQALIRRNASRPTGPWTLTILHTTDVTGFIDPCG